MNTNSTEIKNEIVNEIINPNPEQGGTGNLPDASPNPSDPIPQSCEALLSSPAASFSEKLGLWSPSPSLKVSDSPNAGRGRPSKVSRLPQDVREWINESLLRNIPGYIIVEELEERGFPDFNEMNISTWRNGGFKRWLKDQENVADQQARRDMALAYAQRTGCSLDEALRQASLDNFYQLACNLDIDSLLRKMQDDPELFLKASKLSVSLLRISKEINLGAANKEINKEIPPGQKALWPRRKGGLTLEERDAAEKRMRLFE